MADNTKIEWADSTINAVNGCSVLSPGCTNCYAMKLAGTRMKSHPSRAGLTMDTKAGPVWTGEVRLHEPALLQPLRWKRSRRIFWNAHGDLFHPNVPWEWAAKVMAVAFLTPHHTHMILTKRADRMRAWFDTLASEGGAEDFSEIIEDMAESVGRECDYPEWTLPLENVWLGASVEDRARKQRLDDLREVEAVVRFISAEPLLEDLGEINLDGIDWVIVGGESGPKARPMHPAWARSLRDQCLAAGVAFHFKQWGEWAPVSEMAEEMIDGCYHPAPERQPDATRRCRVDQCVLHRDGERFDGKAMFERPAFEQGRGAMTMMAIGKKRAGRLLDGREWNEAPPAGERG